MTRARSRSKPSATVIDREWPHQIALPDELCCDPNFKMIGQWFADSGVGQMTRQVTAVWSQTRQETWRLYCFRKESDANAFQAHFGGVRFDPKRDRHKGLARAVAWHRTGTWEQMTASGPLRLHPIFLEDRKTLDKSRSTRVWRATSSAEFYVFSGFLKIHPMY